MRVVGADHAVRKDEVDDEEKQHAGLCEDVGGNGDVDVCRARGPDDTHGQRRYPGHAETEGHRTKDKLVVPLPVHLEDRHVDDGARDEEHQQHRGYRVIDFGRRLAAELGDLGQVRRP